MKKKLCWQILFVAQYWLLSWVSSCKATSYAKENKLFLKTFCILIVLQKVTFLSSIYNRAT